LIAYFIGNAHAKKISKFIDVCQSYSKPNAGRILRHGVDSDLLRWSQDQDDDLELRSRDQCHDFRLVTRGQQQDLQKLDLSALKTQDLGFEITMLVQSICEAESAFVVIGYSL